jgi:hypothetical protein
MCWVLVLDVRILLEECMLHAAPQTDLIGQENEAESRTTNDDVDVDVDDDTS